MRDQNSTKKTRRWPPRVGKRHRHDGNAPAEHPPKNDAPGRTPRPEEKAGPAESHRRHAVIISRRSQLRDAVARRRLALNG